MRRARHCRQGGVGDGGQLVVVGGDALGGVARLAQAVGDDKSHGLAGIADDALGENRPRRFGALVAVAALERDDAGNIADAAGGKIAAGEHQAHAFGLARHAGFEPRDARMGVR